MATDPRFDGAGPDAHYRQALNDGQLLIQHCRHCAGEHFPPALVCRHCGSADLAWRESSGKGAVYAVTTVRDRAGDYNVSLVDLEGGARMMSRIEGVDPQQVSIGQPVRARIVRGEDPYVVFRLAGGDNA